MFQFITSALNLLTFNMFKSKMNSDDKQQDSLFKKLIKDNNNYSVGNFFLIVLTMVAILLLLVPMSLLIEMFFHKTITTDLNGMAAYILAVVSLLGIGGGTFGWVEWSKNKYSSDAQDIIDRNRQNDYADNSTNINITTRSTMDDTTLDDAVDSVPDDTV